MRQGVGDMFSRYFLVSARMQQDRVFSFAVHLDNGVSGRTVGGDNVSSFGTQGGEFFDHPPTVGTYHAGVGHLRTGERKGSRLIRPFAAGKYPIRAARDRFTRS